MTRERHTKLGCDNHHVSQSMLVCAEATGGRPLPLSACEAQAEQNYSQNPSCKGLWELHPGSQN